MNRSYDLFIRMLSGQLSQADAAVEAGVDRSTITRICTVARDGAIAALQASKPGRSNTSRAERSKITELETEVARLQATIIEQAVELADRRLNSAIHFVAVTQVRMPNSIGQAYYDKKIADGKTCNEAMRCLKRRLANHIWRLMMADENNAQRQEPTKQLAA